MGLWILFFQEKVNDCFVDFCDGDPVATCAEEMLENIAIVDTGIALSVMRFTLSRYGHIVLSMLFATVG